MPVFHLTNDLIFPNPDYAENEGILALGGDLSVERLLLAYSNGIFPWYVKDEPIMWWSPDPRCVLFTEKFKLSKSLRLLIQKGTFEVRIDTCFRKVIKNCADAIRKEGEGTWITAEMQKAYIKLHKAKIIERLQFVTSVILPVTASKLCCIPQGSMSLQGTL